MDGQLETNSQRRLEMAGEQETWGSDPTHEKRWRLQRRSAAWRPPTDVYETEAEYVVMVEVAGMRGADFGVTLERGILSIRGLRREQGGLKAYHQMEIAYGEFLTQVRIPNRVDMERVEASYQDGFLKVVLPKIAPHKISIG
jgi:HSP20 family protein